MKVGLALPSFREEPDVPLAVAATAEAAGVDAVFVYDHLFRVASDGRRRPALECTALLGALADATERIALGTLVVRATLRAPATLAAALDTVQRIAGPRLLVGIGAGDSESRDEMVTFGLEFGSLDDRLAALRAAVAGIRDRGYPVWVGGSARQVGAIATEVADGWNRWGAPLARFAEEAESVLRARAEIAAHARRGTFTVSWGGLVLLGETEAAAGRKAARLGAPPDAIVGGPERVAEALRRFGAAGASWAIVGPVDSSDPENASILGERVAPLLR